MTDQRRPSRPFWFAVLPVILALYPLSIGPASWLLLRAHQYDIEFGQLSARPVFAAVYTPLFWAMDRWPESVGDAFDWYLGIWL